MSTSFDTNIYSCSQNDFTFTSSHKNSFNFSSKHSNDHIKQRSNDKTPLIKASSHNIPLKISSPCLVYFPFISKKSKLRVDKGMWLSKGTYKGVGSYHCKKVVCKGRTYNWVCNGMCKDKETKRPTMLLKLFMLPRCKVLCKPYMFILLKHRGKCFKIEWR